MKLFKNTSATLVLVAFSFFTNAAHCLELKQQTLEEKVALSELVFIGKIKKIIKNTQDFGYDLAIVEPIETLKGTPAKDIRITFNGTIPEAQPNCCKTRESYLFFVSKNPKGDYYPVNDRYGVYPLSDDMKYKK